MHACTQPTGPRWAACIHGSAPVWAHDSPNIKGAYIYTSFGHEAAHYPSLVEDTLHLMLHCSCETMQQSVKVHLGTPSKSQFDTSYPRKTFYYSGDHPTCTKKLTTASLQSTPQDLTNQTFPSARRAVNVIPPLVFPNSKSDRSQRSEKRDPESASMQSFADHTPRSSMIVDSKMSA
jgi:hypothetical protein